MTRKIAAVAAMVTGAILTVPSVAGAGSGSTSEVFVPSAHVNGKEVTLPLHEARTADGRTAWFVVIEASNGDAAKRWNVAVVNKLANAGNAATQQGRLDSAGRLVVDATVDFTPRRDVGGTPGTGFPPTVAKPGSVGEAGYSPLVRLPGGAVLNAPQIANASGLHDKVLSIDYGAKRVTLELTDGFARGNAVRYLSTDASAEDVAALEGSTWVRRLTDAPRAGDDSTASARASLAAFINGPTGAANPQRQGVNSALLGEGDPLNVLAWTPNQGRYSPLWDVHLTAWAPGRQPVRVTEFSEVENLASDGQVTGPGGAPWRANNVVVNCPIIVQL